MPVQRLKRYLDENEVSYRVIRHAPSFTSIETADAAYEATSEFAKTVMLKVDQELMMVVIPAEYKIDFQYLRHELNAREIRLATEDEFIGAFPDCEPGAMPPFGELYDMDVFIDESFADHEMISFNAGSHREIIKMHYRDFIRVANAKPLRFILLMAT